MIVGNGYPAALMPETDVAGEWAESVAVTVVSLLFTLSFRLFL